ncbi:K02A2.6-like, partial [Cordylochernes scorpioides]
METQGDFEDLRTLKELRTPRRIIFTKKVNEVLEELRRVSPDEDLLMKKKEFIVQHYQQIKEFNRKIEIEIIRTEEHNEKAVLKELESTTQYEEMYIDVLMEINKILEAKTEEKRAMSEAGGEGSRRALLRLPKMELPCFDGDLEGWISWWSRFKRIHEDRELDDDEKMHYLVQAMVPGSRAHRLLGAYTHTGKNYESAIGALKGRFGDKKLLIELYLRKLINLVVLNARRQSANLDRLYDEISAYLQSLESLSIPSEYLEVFLFPLVESCLPTEILQVWQRTPEAGYGRDDEKEVEQGKGDRLKALIGFLRAEIKAQQRINISRIGVVEKNSVVETVESHKTKIERKSVVEESEKSQVEKKYVVEVDENHKAEIDKMSVIETESAEPLTKEEDVIAGSGMEHKGSTEHENDTRIRGVGGFKLESAPVPVNQGMSKIGAITEMDSKSRINVSVDRIGILEALVDTGADLSIVDLRTALETGVRIETYNGNCIGPDGKRLNILGSISMDIKIDEKSLNHRFVVLESNMRSLIIGRDLLRRLNAKINCKRDILEYDIVAECQDSNEAPRKIINQQDEVVPQLCVKLVRVTVKANDGEYVVEPNEKLTLTNGLRIARCLITVRNKLADLWITNPYPRTLKIMKNQTLGYASPPTMVNYIEDYEEDKVTEIQINEDLTLSQKNEIRQVLSKYSDLFSSKLGKTNLAKHRIDTENAKPIKHKPYRVNPKERDIIKEQIQDMLQEGVIRASSSPWAFPVILVRKRDGNWRFCVDYRKLNSITVKDVYPIPRIDDVMDTLQGSRYFTAIDLRSGYWQVEIDEQDKKKTAFTTSHGLYEFNVMPFGLCNAPATFERIMDNSSRIPTNISKTSRDVSVTRRANDRLLKIFKEENGCLYKRNPRPEGRAWLLVVPRVRRKDILKEHHNHMICGYFGVTRTMHRLKDKYFWPSMLKDVVEYVRTCHLCQSRKGSNQLPAGLLHPIPAANYPFERVGIDFLGPLPSSKNRKKWMIVLTDYYTKYAETKAVIDATAREVAKFLTENVILKHGAPRYLISDRGSQFTSNLVKEITKICQIQHCLTTSYHPQTNGLTERLNRTLINMISMYVNVDQRNWDEILPFITHAYNTTIQETIKYSPFFLLYGREPVSILDDTNIFIEPDSEDYDEYVSKLMEKIVRTRDIVKVNTEKSQEMMINYYNQKHRQTGYEPGDLVALWTPIRKPGKCEKLLRRYFGPYIVLKKISDLNYSIVPEDNPGNRTQPTTVHISRIKPYFARMEDGKEAYNIFEHLDLSDEQRNNSDEIINALTQHFTPKINIIYERSIFNQTNQETNESIEQYICRLRKLSSTCNYGAMTEEMIRDRYCATFHEHNRQKCPAWNQTCRKCNKKNHWAKVCKSRMRTVQSLESQNSNDEQEDCYSLEYVSEISARKLMTKLELELNGYKESIIFQIDTGATVNVLSFADLCKIMQDGNPSLKPSYIKLRCYGGEILKPRGQIKINCSHQSKQHPIVFQVIDHWEKPILSAETCQKLNLIEIKADLCKIESTWTKQNNLLDKYKDIFEGIGCLQGEYKLETDPTIKPIKQAPRRVPITLRKELKEKLIDMEKKNIIAKVDYPTDWISNLVLVKSTKKLRICIDPRELNVALKRAEYPIPTIEEIIPNLQNAKIFTVVDTKDGFWNVKLSDESSNLTTFWTPFGRYKFLRMPFGLKTASEEYQRRLYEIFQGLEGIEIIADDILILGKGDSYEEALKDHDRNLENLFKTARQANLKFNINKVKLRLKEVKYLGHIITPHGLKPDPEKVKALKEMPHPESITELKSFLGFATYLCKFMPNISMISEPLRKLTMKNSTWSWSKNHQAAFEQIKDLASKAPILRYFDADKSIAIQCDASKHGLGATLLQESQPIIFAYRSLSKTEQNYAQIEKECLAIVFACERFHQYILGKCQVIVQTDLKPLLSIFKKSILKAPQRLQRMLLRLQRYNLELEHVQGSQMHLADIFSRACIKDVRNENLKYDVYPIDIIYKEIATINVMETLSVCSDTVLRIREETSSDPILCEVKKLILNGWPPNKNQTSMLTREYWNFREELTVQDGIILKNDKIVIPKKLRAEMIMKTHQGHIGINSSMRRARDNIFWPGMNAQIGQEIENCSICLSNSQNQVREPMKSHKIPNYLWERISLDIFDIFKQNYLIIVDHYSDFFKVECLENTTSEYIIECCKRQFSRYGIPQIIVSDNGRQFTSTEFQKFSKEWQFQHSTSSPLHSQGNGKAEAAVKIAKNLLKKFKQENSDFWQNLLNWRNTPTIDIDSSPVQRIMSRRTRAILPIHPNLLKPSIPENIPDKTSIKRQQAKYYYDRKSKNLPDLDIGQEVYVRTPNTTPSWSKANITNEHNTRSYDVNIHGRTYRRNRTWIKPQQASANQKYTNNQEEGRKESIDQEQTVSNCLPSTSSAGGDNIVKRTRIETTECRIQSKSDSPT